MTSAQESRSVGELLRDLAGRLRPVWSGRSSLLARTEAQDKLHQIDHGSRWRWLAGMRCWHSPR